MRHIWIWNRNALARPLSYGSESQTIKTAVISHPAQRLVQISMAYWAKCTVQTVHGKNEACKRGCLRCTPPHNHYLKTHILLDINHFQSACIFDDASFSSHWANNHLCLTTSIKIFQHLTDFPPYIPLFSTAYSQNHVGQWVSDEVWHQQTCLWGLQH